MPHANTKNPLNYGDLPGSKGQIPSFILSRLSSFVIYIHKKMKQNRFIEKRLDFQADLRYN